MLQSRQDAYALELSTAKDADRLVSLLSLLHISFEQVSGWDIHRNSPVFCSSYAQIMAWLLLVLCIVINWPFGARRRSSRH